jgi:hypothetical protein
MLDNTAILEGFRIVDTNASFVRIEEKERSH